MSSVAGMRRFASHQEVVVVGGGQAGLSASWWLRERGVQHVVLEAERLCHEWTDRRWDTFCLVTPNWQCRLPGYAYAGEDPDGFMVREELRRWLAGYAASFAAPVLERVRVNALTRRPRSGFALRTTAGDVTADQVLLATGPYQHAVVPALAAQLPDHVFQLHTSAYRNPGQLPDGAVLVVGSGQSGAQVAEDLHLAGRQVHLCVGTAPRISRRYRGRDVVAWLDDMGYYEKPFSEHHLGEGVRERANHYVTGRDGGRDIDLRQFALEGLQLHGRLLDVNGTTLRFGADLGRDLDAADGVSDAIKDSIDGWIDERRVEAPAEPRYVPVWRPGADHARTLDLATAGVTTVVWGTGYRPDYGWVEAPFLDGTGYPRHERGVTAVPGLLVLGLPWLHTWGSARFAGIARDAEHVVDVVIGRRGQLAAGGDEVTVLALGKGGDTALHRQLDRRVRVHVIPVDDVAGEPLDTRVARMTALLAAAVDPRRYDVLHAQDCLAANAVLDAGGCCVRTVHHLESITSPALVACHERALREPSALVCVSASVAGELAATRGLTASVVPNGVQAPRFARASGPAGRAAREAWRQRCGGERLLLTVGGVEPRKGTLELVEALAVLRARGPRWRLAIAGGESLFDYRHYRQEVLQAVRRLRLQDEVVVLGPVADAALPSLVAACDVFALPSAVEGFGLSAMEALAAGRPTVVTDLPVFREVFGATVSYGSGAAGLTAVVLRAGAGERDARAGRALAASHTWAATAAAHSTIYAVHAARRRPARPALTALPGA